MRLVVFMLALSVAFGGGEAAAQSAGSAGGPQRIAGQLAFQLYSSRNFPPLEDQLRTLADLGYRRVEFGATSVGDPEAMAVLLGRHGLTSPSGHFDLARLREDFGSCASLARLFGMRIMIVPYLALWERPLTPAGWDALGTEMEALADRAAEAGLTLAWHSHDFELQPLADGSYPLDRLFAAAPDLKWQPDIGWLTRAGVDPAEWLRRYQERIVAVHLKDVAPAGVTEEGGWADVGFGIVDWSALLPILAASPAEVFVVEHDEPGDYVRFARRSLATVAGWR